MSTTTATRPPTTAAVPDRRRRLRRLTRAAGVLYLTIFVVYPLSTFVRSSLVVPGDAAATAESLAWRPMATAAAEKTKQRMPTSLMW